VQLHVGFARLLYPFFAGVLLMRTGKRIHLRGGFAICSLLVIATLCMPRIGGPLWMNGLYEAFCIIVVFPIIVAIGAGERISGGLQTGLSKLLGEISYPLYITHYPLIYVYTAWVVRDKVPVRQGAAVGVLLFIASITIAYACLKLYDEPVRKWLSRRFLAKAANPPN